MLGMMSLLCQLLRGLCIIIGTLPAISLDIYGFLVTLLLGPMTYGMPGLTY